MALKLDLRVLEEVLAVGDCDFIRASAQLLKVELAILAHLSDILVVGKECYQLVSLFFGLGFEGCSFLLVCVDQLGSDLVLKWITLGANVSLENEEEKMWVEERRQLLDLSDCVHF